MRYRINDIVDALDLPRNTGERLLPGACIVATVMPDGGVEVAIHEAATMAEDATVEITTTSVLPVTEQTDQPVKRGPGRPRSYERKPIDCV